MRTYWSNNLKKTSAMLGCMLLVLLCILPTDVYGQTSEIETDQRLLSGLRQRKLFRLASLYCKEELAEKNEFQRQASLTSHLIYTLSQRARYSNRQQRTTYWAEAQKVMAGFKKKHSGHPHFLLVEFQAAKAELSRGQQLRQEAQLLPNSENLLNTASRQLAVASLNFSNLEQGIAEEKRKIARNRDEKLLSSRELMALESNVQFQLAKTYRNLAQCYSFGSNDQIDALTQALKRLDQLYQSTTVEELYWPVRLDRVDCYRLQKKYKKVRLQNLRLIAEKPSQDIFMKLTILSAKAALDQKEVDSALLLLENPLSKKRVTIESIQGPWDDVYLRCLLASWKQAVANKETDKATARKKLVFAKVQQIESDHPGYWASRAQLLVAGSIDTGSTNASSAMLTIAARNYYLAKNYSQAIDAYLRAAKKAASQKQAFDLMLKAASIQQQYGKSKSAIVVYTNAALSDPKHSQAASVHLHAILLAKKLKKPLSASSIEKTLQQHLKLWPDSPTSDRAKQILGDHHIAKKQWAKAIEQFHSISSKFKYQEYIKRQTAICYRAHCIVLQREGKSAKEVATKGADWIDKTIAGSEMKWPAKWTKTARWMILASAELRLRYTNDGYFRVEQALTSAIAGSPDADQAWTQTANSFLIHALVGQKKRKQAADLLQNASGGNPSQLLSLVAGLSKLSNSNEQRVLKEIAELQLQLVDLIEQKKSKLSKQQQLNLQRMKAQALNDAGQYSQAVTLMAKVAKQNPKSSKIQQEYAQLLASGSTKQSWQAALSQWRYCQRRQKTASDGWFRAKYEIANLHRKLGNRDQLKKIITQLQTLHPKMGGPEMRAKFLRLLEPEELESNR